jgi:hypothetical protein
LVLYSPISSVLLVPSLIPTRVSWARPWTPTTRSGPRRLVGMPQLLMSKKALPSFTRTLNGGLSGDYAGLKTCVGLTLGWTSSTTYAASEEMTLTQEVNLAAADYDRYYAFATVLDVLRIRAIATGTVIGEAVTRTDNVGYFVTDRYGGWQSTPRHAGAPR